MTNNENQDIFLEEEREESEEQELQQEQEEQEEYYDFRYNSLKKKGTIISICMIWIFCLVIFGTAGLHFLTEDKSFSDSENRVLGSFPRLTAASIADGSFMEDFEAYLTDQFPFRDSIIALKTATDRILGKNEENGVYIGKEGFLFDSQTPMDKSRVNTIGKAVKKFTEKYSNLKAAFVLAPNSSYIYSQYLPDYLGMPSQRDQIKQVKNAVGYKDIYWPAVPSVLTENAEKTQLYYKTDHHWTTRGAYLIFRDICLEWGLESSYKDINSKFRFYEVSNTFEGTLASNSGVHDTTDKIEICVPEDSEGTYVAHFESTGEKTASLFFEDRLGEKNQYEVFLGGNYDKVIISTTTSVNRNLLLIKDSYANCMIPMLTPYFSKIVVIDPRYLTDSLDSIIKENDFSHIMFLYNVNTLLEDNSLVPCLES